MTTSPVYTHNRCPTAARPPAPRATALLVAACTLLATACAEEPTDADPSEQATRAAPEDNDPMSVTDGPSVQRLSLTQPSLSLLEPVTVTVVLSDPDGLEDIAGGLLVDDRTDAIYQSFIQVSAGIYETQITWDTLHRVNPIEFKTDGRRLLRAEFVDNDGHVGTAPFELSLDCGGLGACDGVCTDLNTQNNCGACQSVCDEACIEGHCVVPVWSECFKANTITCNEACAQQGLTCAEQRCDRMTQQLYDDLEDCEEQWPYALAGFDTCGDVNVTSNEYVRCCCG